MVDVKIDEEKQAELQAPKKTEWRKEIKDWTRSIVLAFVIVFLVNQFVFNLSTVDGSSMEPTLVEDEWLFVNRAVYLLGEPSQGEVVILKDPSQPYGERSKYLVKRVVAVPGDSLAIENGVLIINGERVNESYVKSLALGSHYPSITLSQDEYFVLGDNRTRSRDSRDFGPVSIDLIKGRADFILWPVQNWTGL